MPLHEQIKYKFNFGSNISVTIETDSLENEVESWIQDGDQMQKFWNSSRTKSKAFEQYDEPEAPLSAIIKSFADIIENDNQHPSTVMLKKQVVLLTDYIPVNVTEAMNTITSVAISRAVNFPVYSSANDIISANVRWNFQKTLDFEFPKSVYQGKPSNREKLFMMGFDAGTVLQVMKSTAASELCSLPSNKMLSDFLVLKFAHNGSAHDLTIPFLGDRTTNFAQHCIENIDEQLGVDSGDGCDDAVIEVLDEFVNSLRDSQNFSSLLITDTKCAAQRIANFSEPLAGESMVRLISSQNLNEVFDELTLPLFTHGYLNSSLNRQIVLNTAYYLGNFSTSCRSEMPH
ncbi:hypothetical protein OSTOST_16395, partial [Ostertagia ostertagi]